MIKNNARSIHPGECTLHLWKATQHSVVLCTVTSSTLDTALLKFVFYYLILMLLFLLLDHFFCHVCGIPYCCFLISIFLLLSLSFPSFWLFFLLFLFDFFSHTLPVFPQKKSSPLFSSCAFNLYHVILLSSLQEPHECPSTSTAQYLQLKTNLLARTEATD